MPHGSRLNGFYDVRPRIYLHLTLMLTGLTNLTISLDLVLLLACLASLSCWDFAGFSIELFVLAISMLVLGAYLLFLAAACELLDLSLPSQLFLSHPTVAIVHALARKTPICFPSQLRNHRMPPNRPLKISISLPRPAQVYRTLPTA